MLGVHFFVMSDSRGDAELLREYVRSGSREALGEIARRYIDLVYSAARRYTRDAHLAEDVTQAVFILLSQRAGKVREPGRLVGWLYQTTYFTAKNALKIQRRRRVHERAFAQEQTMTFAPEPDQWTEIAPVIDRAMAELDGSSRDMLLMRYFQGKSVQEVATANGVSVEAAQKRLSRALEKLRGQLGRKGVGVESSAAGTMLRQRSVEAAPLALHQSILATAGSGGSSSIGANQIVKQMNRWTRMRMLGIGTAVVGAAAASVLILISLAESGAPASGPPANQVAQVAQPVDDRAAISTWDASMNGGPIEKPWPLALPGAITGSIVPADLFGDGKKEIIVPCMGLDRKHLGAAQETVHPHPTLAALVYAFYPDGTTVPGFPAQIVSQEVHLAGEKAIPRYSEHWGSAPSIVKIQGKDVIVMPGPNGRALSDRAVFVIRGDGSVQRVEVGGWKPDPWTTIAVTTLREGGRTELLGGYADLTDGLFRLSRLQQALPGGFGTCVGDARGDGQLEYYQAGYQDGNSAAGVAEVTGYDQSGRKLAGWPQACGFQTGATTVMGDIIGDGKMDVVMVDGIGRLMAWTWDGKPVPGAVAEDPAEMKKFLAAHGQVVDAIPKKDLCTSILRMGIGGDCPLSLADLDGDGKAEIVLFDAEDGTLRAFHGDGKGFGNEDGIIAKLPKDIEPWGVSVASLGGGGAMDFFVGTYWVRRLPDGTTTVTNMLPGGVSHRCQATITDIDGDGMADILMGTQDGRVFIYHTGKAYRPEWVQWATSHGDLNHTSCWHKPGATVAPPAR
jgi:RNA polymerase sigma factor (sigma-70 family)